MIYNISAMVVYTDQIEAEDVSGYRWWDNAIDNALSIIDRHINEEGGDKE